MRKITIRKKSFDEGHLYIGKDFISNGFWALKNKIIRNIDIFEDAQYAARYFGTSVEYQDITFEEILHRWDRCKSNREEYWQVSQFIIGFYIDFEFRVYTGSETDKLIVIPEKYYQWLQLDQLFSCFPDEWRKPRVVYNCDKTILLRTTIVDDVLSYNGDKIMEILLNRSSVAKPKTKGV